MNEPRSRTACAVVPRGERGFTLIEVLIAILVLVGGMVSVLALFGASVSIHRQAVDDARTALIAEEVLDRIRTVWSETGDPAQVRALEYLDPRFHPYRVEADLDPYAEGAGALGVVVRVTWRRGKGERTARFESVVFRDGFDAAVRSLRSGGKIGAVGAAKGEDR